MATAMSTRLLRAFDTFTVVFFASTFVLATIVDMQLVFPGMHPQWALDLVQWHIQEYNDHLTRDRPAWYMGMLWQELLFHFPFYLVAIPAYLTRCNWIRIPTIAWGVQVTAVTLLSEADLFFGEEAAKGNTNLQFAAITGLWVVVRLAIALRMAASTMPFGQQVASKGKAKTA